MGYAVFESTNMASTHFAERIFDAVCDENVENGTFGYLDGLAEGHSNIYNFKKGTADGAHVVVADNPAWNEDTCRITNQRRDQYVIEAGTPFRVRVVKVNDEFAISIDGITPATQSVVTDETDFTANDVLLTIDDTGKLKAATATTEVAVMEARIERKRLVGGTLVTKERTYGRSGAMYEARVRALGSAESDNVTLI